MSDKKIYTRKEVRYHVHQLRNIASKIDGYLALRRTATSRGKKSFYQRKIQEKTDEILQYLNQI